MTLCPGCKVYEPRSLHTHDKSLTKDQQASESGRLLHVFEALVFTSSSHSSNHAIVPSTDRTYQLRFVERISDPLPSRTIKHPRRVTLLSSIVALSKYNNRGPSFSGSSTSVVDVGYPVRQAGGKEGRPSTSYYIFWSNNTGFRIILT